MCCFGKGDKERIVYFDIELRYIFKIILMKEMMIISFICRLKAPYDRLTIGGVETRIKKLGED